MRYVWKNDLMGLVQKYNYDRIPKEVIEHWVKMWGHDEVIEPSQTDRSNDKSSSHSAPPSNVDDTTDVNVNENSDGALSKSDVSMDNKEEKS